MRPSLGHLMHPPYIALHDTNFDVSGQITAGLHPVPQGLK